MRATRIDRRSAWRRRYTEMVRTPYRIATGLVLLLALTGLPVAAVLCDLVCPQELAGGAATPAPALRVAAAHVVSCHEVVGAAAPASSDAAARPDNGRRGDLVDAAPAHGCDHPTVVAARWSPERPRLTPPSLTWDTPLAPTSHAAWSARRTAALPHARPTAPLTVGAFSPVLRI